MILSQAQLTIGRNQVSIAQDDLGGIYCFKHDRSKSEWEYFDNLESATDFIFSNIPDFKYQLSERKSD